MEWVKGDASVTWGQIKIQKAPLSTYPEPALDETSRVSISLMPPWQNNNFLTGKQMYRTPTSAMEQDSTLKRVIDLPM